MTCDIHFTDTTHSPERVLLHTIALHMNARLAQKT